MNENASKFSRLLMTVLLLTFMVGSALATNGYFRHGYGTRYRGLAGAGTALALSSLAGATNPAGMVFVGKRYDIGISLFSPDLSFGL